MWRCVSRQRAANVLFKASVVNTSARKLLSLDLSVAAADAQPAEDKAHSLFRRVSG
jgi:hypothetical protein